MNSSKIFLSVTITLLSILGAVIFVDLERHDEIFIPNVEANKVFSVFSNFTNLFILEPNLIRFKLLAEVNGEEVTYVSKERRYNEFEVDYQDVLLNKNQSWGYKVWYEEFYQYLPSILTNKNEGEYVMSRDHKSEDTFIITSHHTTEFLPGRPISTKCVNLLSNAIKEGVSGTLVTENLYYESPILFVPIAYAEVEYQRPKVLKALANWNYN